MNVNIIKESLEHKKGKILHFRFNGSRNQIEEFSGVIDNTYNSVFVIRNINSTNKIKSFTYGDILTSSLEILKEKSSI